MTIDTHQHFWNLRREPMPWMRPEHAVIAGDAAAHRILEDTPAHAYCLAESPGAVSVLGAGETDSALIDQAIAKVRPLELCLARMDAAETTRAFIAADEEFHRIIATASGNSTPALRIEHVSAVSESAQWRTHMVEVDGAAETQ